jgi:uncharacterized protein (TIGR00369 family)
MLQPMDLAVLRNVIEDLIPFNKFLGIRVGDLRHGGVTLELGWRDELIGDPLRPAMHGGVISALADTTGGMAVWSALENPHARVSTIDLRVDYLRPGKLEAISAEGRLIRLGGRVGVADVRLFHPSNAEETVATGKGVYAIKIPKH